MERGNESEFVSNNKGLTQFDIENKKIAEAKKASIMLSNYIAYNGDTIQNGLNSIANELKETKTFNEKIYLQKEIDMLEEELFNMGILKEVYEKAKLKEIPIKKINDEEIEMLCLYNTKYSIELLKSWILKGNGKTPKEIIFDLISDRGLCSYIYAQNCPFWTIGDTEVNFSLSKYCFSNYATIYENTAYNSGVDTQSWIQTDDEEFKNMIWKKAKELRRDFMANSLSQRMSKSMSQAELVNRYDSLSKFINCYYTDYISLINLRNYYEELRQQRRVYKYKLK